MRPIPLEILEAWSDVAAQVGEENVVVAGGCLRDSLHGIVYKDIDMWIKVPEGTSKEEVGKFCSKLRKTTKEFTKSHHKGGDQYSNYVVGCKYKRQDVDLIFSPDPFDIETFDMGICKVWIDKDGLHRDHPDFVKDFDTNTITVICNAVEEWPRTLEHIERVRLKYPTREVMMSLETPAAKTKTPFVFGGATPRRIRSTTPIFSIGYRHGT